MLLSMAKGVLVALLVSSSVHADEKLVALMARAKPSVVSIRTDQGSGSGFIVDKNTVVTNFHVVSDARSVAIKRYDGKEFQARFVTFTDAKRDICIISIPNIGANIRPLALSSVLPKQGEDVIAIGHPKGFELTLTRGVVSAVRTSGAINKLFQINKFEGTWIQTDVAISPGSSGSPLIAMDGRVVGMNTFTHVGGQNLNFAVSCLDIEASLRAAKTSTPVTIQDVRGESPFEEMQSIVKTALSRAFVKHFATMSDARLQALLSSGLDGVGQELGKRMKPTPIERTRRGQVVKLQQNFRFVQLLADEDIVLLASEDIVVAYFTREAADVAARLPERKPFPVDVIAYVGPSLPYTTRVRTTEVAILVIPIGEFPADAWSTLVRPALLHASETIKKETHKRLSRAVRSYRKELQRTFRDSSGRFRVDAIAVGLNEDGTSVQLLRLDNGKLISVPVSRLSTDDRSWIASKKARIRVFGPKITKVLVQANPPMSAAASGAEPGDRSSTSDRDASRVPQQASDR